MKSSRASSIPAIARLSDFPLADAVYVGTVRSPASRGRITSISLPHLPRDYRSITADDIPGSSLMVAHGASVPVLASGRVSYRGEPVALIVGPDRRKVAEALALTKVRVEEEEADFSFEACGSRRLVATGRLDSGDVDKAMATAARVVEGDYRVGPQDHYYSEPQGSAAAFDYDKLVVFSSTQWPYRVRAAVAEALGVKKEEVIVRPTLLGSHLDGKLWYPSLLACHAAVAAFLSSRPALLLLSRAEDFLYTTKRAPMLASYRAGLDEAGRLVALDSRIMINTGAYAPFAEDIVRRAARAAVGGYACPDVRVVARAVRTDLPPMGAFVGLGTGPATFAAERLAEDCAAAAEVDPDRWRAENVAEKGDRTLGPPLRRSVPFDAVADRLLAISDYGRKRSSFELIRKRRPDPSIPAGYGIGLAFGPQLPATAFGRDGASVPSVEATLSKDSILTIRASVYPGSRSAAEIWKESAAAALGLQAKAVRILAPSTDTAPDSGPGSLSRNVTVVTRLVQSACEGLAAKRFREALPITVRKAQRARSSRAAPESPLDDASWGGAVVELELDPVIGTPVVRGVWIVVKAGRILSRKAAAATIEHDAAAALGLCVGERLDLSGGPADLEDLRRYRLPRIKDAPAIVVEFIDDDAPPCGIGELSYALVPPAFANALSQALDARSNSMPLGGASEGR
ncbi:MAG: molybdopterin-dependent oxidoreductase [Spirochaetes bacterium]|nr:molybdopterin-dependent oxidoreductase [Spirochaetota bacterium]MBU1080017.1 molybdopterin-dependent oxidoreductase [Spirochaetota bacterium]